MNQAWKAFGILENGVLDKKYYWIFELKPKEYTYILYYIITRKTNKQI